jgi:hypothetical protein
MHLSMQRLGHSLHFFFKKNFYLVDGERNKKKKVVFS